MDFSTNIWWYTGVLVSAVTVISLPSLNHDNRFIHVHILISRILSKTRSMHRLVNYLPTLTVNICCPIRNMCRFLLKISDLGVKFALLLLISWAQVTSHYHCMVLSFNCTAFNRLGFLAAVKKRLLIKLEVQCLS